MSIDAMSGAVPVITIDGPSGTGKGTLAHLLAARLGWHLLDSGALYRIVAVGAEAQGIASSDIAGLCRFAHDMKVVFSPGAEESIRLDGQEVAPLVRLEESGEKASVIAAIPELREALFERQQAFRRPPGLVADGRDMGTVVFPDARLKFFLTASSQERVQRRYKQLKNKGVSVNLSALLRDIEVRDQRDASRAASPLLPAKTAVVVDTTALDIDQVLDRVLAKVGEEFSRTF
ncbi:MAG: (d)CMP kinase [Pseudomonadales bacterium]|nr:(d)CMP kinase [Pseudomonadales bacterium]